MSANSRLALLLAVILLTSGCGGNGSGIGPGIIQLSPPATNPPSNTPAGPAPTNRKPKFAFTINEQSRNVSGFSVDPASGALTPLSGFPIAVGTSPEFITTDAQGRFAFIADDNAGVIWVYAIDTNTGALQQIPGSPYPSGQEPDWIAVHPSGKYVYVADMSGNAVYGFSLEADTGTLTPIPGSPFPTSGSGQFGECVAIDVTGKFLFETDVSNVYSYSIDSTTGALTLVSALPAPPLTGTVAVDPAGSFIYVVGSGNNSESTYSVNSSTGALTLASTSPLAGNNGAYTITLDASGRFAYTVEGGQYLHAYSVAQGKLSPIGPRLSGSLGSQQLAIDPSNRFLYAPQSGSANSVSAWAIGGTTLVAVPGSPFPTGSWPFSIAITAQ